MSEFKPDFGKPAEQERQRLIEELEEAWIREDEAEAASISELDSELFDVVNGKVEWRPEDRQTEKFIRRSLR